MIPSSPDPQPSAAASAAGGLFSARLARPFIAVRLLGLAAVGLSATLAAALVCSEGLLSYVIESRLPERVIIGASRAVSLLRLEKSQFLLIGLGACLLFWALLAGSLLNGRKRRWILGPAAAYLACLALCTLVSSYGVGLWSSRLRDSVDVSVHRGTLDRAITFLRVCNSLHSLLILLVSMAACCLLLDALFGRRRSRWIYPPALAITGYVAANLSLVRLPPSYLLLYWLAVLALFEANTIDLRRLAGRTPRRMRPLLAWIMAIASLTPLAPDVLAPGGLLAVAANIRSRAFRFAHRPLWRDVSFYAAMAITANLAIFATALPVRLRQDPSREVGQARRIVEGNFYCLQIDPARKRLLATCMGGQQDSLYVFSLGDLKSPAEIVRMDTREIEEIRINEPRDELYQFDRTERGSGGVEGGVLRVYDLKDFRPKRQSADVLRGRGSARLDFDNSSGTIAIAREDDCLWIVDMDTLEPLLVLEVARKSEYLLFNNASGHYALSYFEHSRALQLVPARGGPVLKVAAANYQGAMAVSPRRGELYLALPLRRRIFVYDETSLRLKRKIPTVFGVRFLAYDEPHDLLVAASMCSGYVDVIDMGGGRRLAREFVGYDLRQVCLNPPAREAYISSRIGGVYQLRY